VTPYYNADNVTIYVGDCLEVMPQLDERFDLVFTSPPYNLGTSTGGGFADTRKYPDMKMGKWGGVKGSGGHHKWKRLDHADGLAHGYDDHDDAMPMGEYEEWQRACVTAMWGCLTANGAIFYNHKPRPQRTLWHPRCLIPDALPVRQEIIWARAGGINFAPTHYVPTYEVIIVVAEESWRLKSKGASGVGDVWSVPQERGNPHPAPFPVGLPARAIETTAPSAVLDPFAGSGTTLVAAKAAGVRAVGIEKSERYAEMAAARLDNTTVSLFAAQEPPPEQTAML